MALYGFIAVSGLKMIQKVDLNQNKNLFVVSAVLVSGIGLTVILDDNSLMIGAIGITPIAIALILGIIINLIISNAKEDDAE